MDERHRTEDDETRRFQYDRHDRPTVLTVALVCALFFVPAWLTGMDAAVAIGLWFVTTMLTCLIGR